MKEKRASSRQNLSEKTARLRRNPLPDRAKELEAFFFPTAQMTPTPDETVPKPAKEQAAALPPTTGLFHDPFSSSPSAMN